MNGLRKIILLFIRTSIIIVLILALAGVQLLWPIQQMETTFVVDLSHSMSEHEDKIIQQINRAIHQKDPKDNVAVITTGANASVEMPLNNSTNGLQTFQTNTNPSFTNLSAGLQLARGLFQEDRNGRVVLMTDGNENVGDAVRQASYLKQQGFVVDVLPYQPTSKQDVAIQSFKVPETTYLGEQAKLNLTLESSVNNTSRIRIQKDGQWVIDQQVPLKQGTNQLEFDTLITKDGLHTFRAEVISEVDQVSQNNRLSAISESKGIPRVLIVEGKDKEADNLTNSLRSSAIQTKTIPVELLPTQLSSFLHYDSIVLSNVSAHTISQSQMLLMNKAVKDFGVGLIMTGGEQSFGLGGYFKTPIEEALPVYMDIKGKKEIPSLGLSIVLDKSGSMEGDKIALAREAAARSIELLRERDTLGVIAFDSTPWQIIDTKPINNKEEAIKKVRSITASGGTDIFTPTSQAYSQLMPLELKRKHIILLTDGQSAATMNYPEMIVNGKEKGVTLSTVAIGSGADSILLNEMATLGDGRFYQVNDASSIPSILSRETAMITRTYIEDNPFYPTAVGNAEWKLNFEQGVPKMNAYIATSLKGRAQQVLTSEKEDPVLSRWQYGLGKTVAWTSDLTGKWAGDWPVSSTWSSVWNDIVSWTLPQYNNHAYEVEKTIKGDEIKLKVISSEETPLSLDAQLVSETGEEITFDIQAKAPRIYEGTFKTDDPGVYLLNITEKENGNPISSFKTGVVVPYSEEYSFSAMNNTAIQEIANAGGGRVVDNSDEVFSNKGLKQRYDEQHLFYLLLSLVLLLFLLDVAIRRFRMNFAFLRNIQAPLEGMRSKKEEATQVRTSQLDKLKKASSIKNKGATERKREIKNDKTHQNSSIPTENKQTENITSNVESKQDRFNRLLDAKKKK